MHRLQDQSEMKCGTCFFYYYYGDSYEDGWPYGRCLRFPPVYTGLKIGDKEGNEPFQWEQPAIDPKISVCGEWKQS